jgi:hypothetical protein
MDFMMKKDISKGGAQNGVSGIQKVPIGVPMKMGPTGSIINKFRQ